MNPLYRYLIQGPNGGYLKPGLLATWSDFASDARRFSYAESLAVQSAIRGSRIVEIETDHYRFLNMVRLPDFSASICGAAA